MKMKKKRFFGILLGLALALGLMLGLSATAYAQDAVSYQKWDEVTQTMVEAECTDYTVPTFNANYETTWGNGNWYVINSDMSRIGYPINVRGTANLILCDDKTLTVGHELSRSSIVINDGATLNIYGQSKGSSKLDILSAATGIMVKNSGTNPGTLNIHGGVVKARHTGGGSYPGIGGSSNSSPACGIVNIYGGSVTATTNGSGAGIGTAACGDATKSSLIGEVNIYGGNVTASGNTDGGVGGAGIGSGYYQNTQSLNADSQVAVSIYGGKVKATGGDGSYNNATPPPKESEQVFMIMTLNLTAH